jgi:protein TonB
MGDTIETLSSSSYRFINEKEPSFPGGESELKKFIANNIHYPALAYKNKIGRILILSFIVDEVGNITDPKIENGIGYAFEEALRVISNMPKWEPGKHNGKAIKTRYTLPIKFEFPK